MAKKPSAASRIKAQGKSLVWVTLTGKEKQLVRIAADTVGLPMSRLAKDSLLATAKKIVGKSARSS